MAIFLIYDIFYFYFSEVFELCILIYFLHSPSLKQRSKRKNSHEKRPKIACGEWSELNNNIKNQVCLKNVLSKLTSEVINHVV